MQINIQGHHVDLTDSMQDYVHTKFDKLERFFDHINSVQVVLKVEKINQIAEATLHINQGKSMRQQQMKACTPRLIHWLINSSANSTSTKKS